jgi:hypothetical protein
MTMETTGGAPAAYRVGDAIGFGWKRSWRNFWWLLLVAVILSVISGVANTVFNWQGTPQYDLNNPADIGNQMLSGASDLSGGRIVLLLIGLVVQVFVATFFGLGVVRIGLAVATGDRVRVGHLFSFVGYGRYLAATIIVGIIVSVAAGILIGGGVAIAFARNQIAWAAIGLLLGVVLSFVVSLFFCLFAYAILGENAPNLSSLSRSWELVKPRFWAILGLQILIALIVIGIFVVAIILGVLAICIGLLITIPIAITLTYGIPTFAYAYTYRVLSGQPVS